MATAATPPEVGVRRARSPTALAVVTTVWLASELMFFAGLFASYFTIKSASSDWPGTKIVLSTGQDAAFTGLLVLSSFTMQYSVHVLDRDRRTEAARWVVASFVLGALFLGNQLLEWTQVPFHPATSAYASLFFVMTGFHGLHVLFGLLAMVGLLLRLTVSRTADPAA